jgi:hypothetical protein
LAAKESRVDVAALDASDHAVLIFAIYPEPQQPSLFHFFYNSYSGLPTITKATP